MQFASRRRGFTGSLYSIYSVRASQYVAIVILTFLAVLSLLYTSGDLSPAVRHFLADRPLLNSSALPSEHSITESSNSSVRQERDTLAGLSRSRNSQVMENASVPAELKLHNRTAGHNETAHSETATVRVVTHPALPSTLPVTDPQSSLFSTLLHAVPPPRNVGHVSPHHQTSPWKLLWNPRDGLAEMEFSEIVYNISSAVRETQEWDKAWMLVLQAVMRRRLGDWFSDPRIYGGLFVPDGGVLLERLDQARRRTRSCVRNDTSIVAAVMVRGEGRFIQEYVVWHMFVGISHLMIYYEDDSDGTLDALSPFVEAGFVTAIPTLHVPTIKQVIDSKRNQVHRQQAVYDHALLTLQTVACRYRGKGSPLQVLPCSSTELAAYYANGEIYNRSAVFLDPYTRPRLPDGSLLLGREYLKRLWWQRKQTRQDAQFTTSTATPHITNPDHTLWLTPLDSDEFIVVSSGECFSDVVNGLQRTHVALGLPWQHFLPNDVLMPRDALLLQSITRRLSITPTEGMPKHVTNVQYADFVDVHFPYLQQQDLRDEHGRVIDMTRRNKLGNIVHDWVTHEGRKVWLEHRVSRSIEASVFKGVRQSLDDLGSGNLRSSDGMLRVITGSDVPDAGAAVQAKDVAIRDAKAWLQGREYMLTVLFGANDTARAQRWNSLWQPLSGPIDSSIHSLVSSISAAVAPAKEWDRGWMLALTAIMRRRAKDWFYDPVTHGGVFVNDSKVLDSRLKVARAAHTCTTSNTTVVAAVMVRGEGRYLQEWVTWHLFLGFSHIIVYLDDVDDGSLEVLEPFREAGVVTVLPSSSVSGINKLLAEKENQIKRQQVIYDDALRLLQRVSCRYRGVGSPAAIRPCTVNELEAYYSHESFVNPIDRRHKKIPPESLVGPQWLAVTSSIAQRARRVTNAGQRFSVPRSPHDIWLAVLDSDEFIVTTMADTPSRRPCIAEFLQTLRDSHGALGIPWRDFYPNSVLEPHGSLQLWNLTRTRRLQLDDKVSRRGDIQGTLSMPKFITNVRFTVAVDIHSPFLLAPFAFMDERGVRINEQRNEKGILVHDFGPHAGRRIWNHHFMGRSLEALAWKGVRQYLDDGGGGNHRSSQGMFGTVARMNALQANVTNHLGTVRDGTAWKYGREFMLTVLFGLRPPGPENQTITKQL